MSGDFEHPQTKQVPVDELSPEQAAAELSRLASQLMAANTAYHRDDTPEISDAAYDALNRSGWGCRRRWVWQGPACGQDAVLGQCFQ